MLTPKILSVRDNKTVYDYACLMVSIKSAAISNLQASIDPVDLSDYKGIEDDIHATVLYGIENFVALADVVKYTVPLEKITLYTVGLEVFKGNPEYDVLVAKCKSAELTNMNADIRKNIQHHTDYPNYQPHATVAYLKKGTADKYLQYNDRFYMSDAIATAYLYSADKIQTAFTVENVVESMSKADAQSEIDKIALSAINLLADNDALRQQIQATTITALNILRTLNEEPNVLTQHIANFKADVDTIITASNSIVVEALADETLKAMEVAFKGMYGVANVNAEQGKLLKRAREEYEDAAGTVSNQTIVALLNTLNSSTSDDKVETLRAVLEDAYDNYETLLLDESFLFNALGYYISTFDAAAFKQSRSVDMIVRVAKCDPAEKYKEIRENLLKSATTVVPSYMVAADRIAELKQGFQDWYAAMKYGSVYGTSIFQAQLNDKTSQNREEFVTALHALHCLIQDVAATVGNTASISEFINNLGFNSLRVKLLTASQYVDDHSYKILNDSLQAVGIKSYVTENSGMPYLIVKLDKDSILKATLTQASMELKCLNRVKEIIRCTPYSATLDEATLYKFVTSNTRWWQWYGCTDATHVAKYLWSCLGKADKLKFAGDVDVDNIDYDELSDDCKHAVEACCA